MDQATLLLRFGKERNRFTLGQVLTVQGQVVKGEAVGAGGGVHDKIVLLLGRTAVVVKGGVVLVFVDQLVGALGGAQFVVVDAVHQVVTLQGFSFGGFGVPAVEKAVTVPAGAAELDPLQAVVQVGIRRQVADVDVTPVRAGLAAAVGHVAVILIGAEQADGGGALLVEGVGVDEHLLFAIFAFLIIVDGLIL